MLYQMLLIDNSEKRGKKTKTYNMQMKRGEGEN